MNKIEKTKEEEIRKNISILERQLDRQRDALVKLDIENMETWFEKNKGLCYNYKFAKSDDEFFGTFRIDGIHKDSWAGDLILEVTMVHFKTDKDIYGITFDWKMYKRGIDEQHKITKAQFNSLLKKCLKKIKLS